MIGISTPARWASKYTSLVFLKPSTTWPIDSIAVSTLSPLPSAKPKRRLRDWLSVQVKIKSPRPAIPIKVSGFAPRAQPNRVSSARPRVIKAVRALAPKPTPSEIPAPIAITFLTAPPSCMPIKSSLLYTRNERPQCSKSANCCANSGEVDETEIAVGEPIAISFANVGPESTASAISSPSSCCATSCNKRPVFGSRPLVAHATLASICNAGFICASVSPNAWLGTTTSTIALHATARCKSASSTRVSGKGASGK